MSGKANAMDGVVKMAKRAMLRMTRVEEVSTWGKGYAEGVIMAEHLIRDRFPPSEELALLSVDFEAQLLGILELCQKRARDIRKAEKKGKA